MSTKYIVYNAPISWMKRHVELNGARSKKFICPLAMFSIVTLPLYLDPWQWMTKMSSTHASLHFRYFLNNAVDRRNSIENYLTKYFKETGFWHQNATFTLFRNKRFVLDEKLRQNASKFAILLEYENPCSFFRFSFRATLFFP